MPKTIKAVLLIRYSNGQEKELGDVEIEVDARYQFGFNKIDDMSISPTVSDTVTRIEGQQ